MNLAMMLLAHPHNVEGLAVVMVMADYALGGTAVNARGFLKESDL